MTRAKAAALETNDSTDAGHGTKRALQTKKAGANRLLSTATTETHATTKRSALLDVSNVSKKDLATVKETVGLKKPLVSSRANLVSKAAQPVGVTKPSRTSSTRSTIANADATKKIKSSEPKRPASGSGVMAAGSKRRVLENKTSNQQIYQDAKSSETTAPKVRQHQAKVEIGDDVATAEYEDCKENENVHADHEKVSSTVEETVPTMTASEIAFVHEVERDDADDPLMVAEYVDDIFDYLNDLQTQTMPNPDYMSQQPNLEWKMRGILVDWLVEVHSKYRLLPETLFLAVNIIDRFLSAKHVPLEKLQLCGITAMFIASKYEEVLAPHISHFRDLADDSITEQEILTAERHMLATLKYDLSYPNPMNFLRRISKADSYDISTRTFGKYLLEMTILDYRFMDCPPSLAAAAAMYLSRLILQKSDWVSSSTRE